MKRINGIPIESMDAEGNFIRRLAVKSISSSPDLNHIWAGAFSGFAKINLTTCVSELMGKNANGLKERTFSVFQDLKGEIFVTTALGLRVWRNNQYEMPPFTHPLLHHQPRNILYY